MDRSIFKAGFFHNEDRAYHMLESIRWPNGPICPHCPGGKKIYRLKPGKTGRRVLKCGACRKQFSVTVETIFEDSHLPLTYWLAAMHLMCASKKGISAHQLHRMLGITYKSAWFMAHRIRYAMTEFSASGKLGGIVEADETYIGGKRKGLGVKEGMDSKTPVFALVQRGGKVRSFAMPRVTAKNLKSMIREHVDQSAHIMTDSFIGYRGLKNEFAGHDMVDHHREEWVRGNSHTNTIEGYFSLLKRGIVGTYHHVGSQHLHRYLAEFDFRYNSRAVNDQIRSMAAVKAIEGKRLQHR